MAKSQARQFITPEFFWEFERLGEGCTLDTTGQTLRNVAEEASEDARSPSKPYNFPGTRATLYANHNDVFYWEVWCTVHKDSSFNHGVHHLVSLGVYFECYMEILPKTALPKDWVDCSIEVDTETHEYNFCCWTKESRISEGSPGRTEKCRVSLGAYPDRTEKCRVSLGAYPDTEENIFFPLGFFFDGPSAIVTVFHVDTRETLCQWSDLDTYGRFYPYACLSPKEKVGKEISVELKSGSGINMTDEKRHFLESLTGCKHEPRSLIQTPEIQWDVDTLGPACSLTKMGTDSFLGLSNAPEHRPVPPPSNPYTFPGTRATLSLTAKDLIYWEVWWKVLIPEDLKDAPLFQIGLATEEALKAVTEGEPMESLSKIAVSFVVQKSNTLNQYAVWGTGLEQEDAYCLEGKDCKTEYVEVPLAFFFDGPRSYLYIIREPKSQIIWMAQLDIRQPLYPFVCVTDKESAGTEIDVWLKSGKSLQMNFDKNELLQTLRYRRVLPKKY